MDLFQVIERRRSIRKFGSAPVPYQVVKQALDMALLAPNSSNLQTWDFYWVRSPEEKAKLVSACFGQTAAKTAGELIVVAANPRLWRRSWDRLKDFNNEFNAPRSVRAYYEAILPRTYNPIFPRILFPLRKLMFVIAGWFRPVPRTPHSKRDLEETCIKSAALAAENFVLAITAQGYGSCMMEGFDEVRVRRLLKLKKPARIAMVIGVGEDTGEGIYAPRFRLPSKEVIHEI